MANEGGKKPEIARAGALHKTIPNAVSSITTNTTGGTFDLSALALTDPAATTVDCRGRWITIQALSADVTLLRNSSAPVHGVGLVLVAGSPPEPFYVDPDEDAVIGWDAAGAGTLEICLDTKL